MDEVTRGEVARTVARFLDAFARLDWEAFRRAFAEDATVFFPAAEHPHRATGRDEIERGFMAVFERARASRAGPPYLDLQPRDLDVHLAGDSAIVTFHLRDPGVLCRRTLVLRMSDDGWRIVHLHASNLPRATGETV